MSTSTVDLRSNANIVGYSTENVYLGRKGKVITNNGMQEISIYYSERDGIGWKLKNYKPYKILFDYNDGAYYINDTSAEKYTELILKLNLLKRTACKQHYNKAYAQLEEITAYFLDWMRRE